jgi:hypothetical protein
MMDTAMLSTASWLGIRAGIYNAHKCFHRSHSVHAHISSSNDNNSPAKRL